MPVRTILSVAGVLLVTACAAPGRYAETTTTNYGGGVVQQTTDARDYVPAWAKPGYDHSNFDHRAP
jgi:hypothetical protein